MSDRDLRALERGAAVGENPAGLLRGLARAGRQRDVLRHGAPAGPPRCSLLWEFERTGTTLDPAGALVLPDHAYAEEPIDVPVEGREEREGVLVAWAFVLPREKAGEAKFAAVNAVEFRHAETGLLLSLKRIAPLFLGPAHDYRFFWTVAP